MKKLYTPWLSLTCFVIAGLIFNQNSLYAQCNNSDFSTGDFTGWSGTYGTNAFGTFCYIPSTNQYTGFNQGPLNTAPNITTTQWNQVICSTAGGNDVNLASYGATLPMVYPGAQYSARIGNMWPDVGGNGYGDGETITYSMLVTASNCNFTYHYAVVLNDGGHAAGQQPFFNISMKDGSGNDIACGDFEVDASTAQTIGGFNPISSASIWWKPWTSVFVPLNGYIGQTVTITFTTRSCFPCTLGICCEGSHYAYAYIDAECAPLTLVASSPTICGGTDITLTAPAGAATYAWSGPGIVSGGNTQVVTVNQPGPYSVTMTTFGNTPCTFTLDTIAPANPNNPSASFSAPAVCVGSPMQFTDHSAPAGQISAWSWNFNNGAGTATTQNPAYTFPAAGTYPVKLTVTSTTGGCTADTTINVVVTPAPDATFTASTPVCEGTNSSITYTGTDPATDTYTWNFNGGTVVSGTGQGPYQVNWASGGNKNVTLTVSVGSCSSPQSTQVVVVNPFPGLVLPGDTSVCTGGSVTIVASGATTYAWTPAAGLNSTSTATVIATPATTTTYSVTGTSASCTGTATITVAVNPIPTSPFTITPAVCTGQDATVTYTGNAGAGANYIWNFNGGNAAPATGQGPIQVNWATPGTQDVSLTVTQSGCSSTQTTRPVTVNPVPTSTFIVTTPLCTGRNGTVTFTGSATANAVYTWGWSGGNIVQGAGAGPYTVNWATAGTQNVTLSITDNGCTSPATTLPVVVNAIPTATISGPPSVCALANATFTYSGSASVNATYNWGFDNGNAAPGGTVQGPQQISWAAGGPDTVTLTVTENGCTSPPDTAFITVNDIPTSVFTAATPVCVGEASAVTYTGTGDNTATYIWDFGTGNAVPGTGQGPQQVTWAAAGTQSISLAVTENGCSSQLTTQSVVVNAIPTAAFTVSSPLCVNQPGTITYTGTSSPAAILTWGFDGGNAVPNTGRGPIQISWNAAGAYVVSLNVTDNTCVAIPDSIPVTVNSIPTANAGDDTAYCSGNTVQLGTASTVGYTYQWSPATGLSDPTASNPVVSLTNTANSVLTETYTVTASSNNCTATASATVTVNPVPVANFTRLAPQCLPGNSFNFVAGGTFLPSATFAWNFGSFATPATSVSQTQTVSYTSATTSNVSLAIAQNSCTDTFTEQVTVNPVPQAAFFPDTTNGCPNFEVCFTNNSQVAGTSTYTWNFGDGESSADSAPCHLYVAPGQYSVYLKVTSLQGCFDTITETDIIKVIADPVAAFTPNVTEVLQPQSEIDFTNQSSNALTYLWAFNNMGVNNGILGTSTDINPNYNFTQYGLYNVMLHAYNALGCSDSTQQQVTVLPPKNFYIPNAFIPNGSGVNSTFYAYLQEGATLREFRIFDRWGEKVHDGLYPWDGTYLGKESPEGVYIYVAVIHLDTEVGNIMRTGSVTLIR